MTGFLDIICLLTEGGDSLLPWSKTGANTWQFTSPNGSVTEVQADKIPNPSVNIMHIAFQTNGSYDASGQLGTSASRALWTIADIVRQIPADIFVFIRDDADVGKGVKKSSIYGRIVLALRGKKIVVRSNVLELDSGKKAFWAIPAGSNAKMFEDDEVNDIIVSSVDKKFST